MARIVSFPGVTDNLIAAWPLQENSGSAEDIEGNNDGSVFGASQGVSGPVSDTTAYGFDGSNDGINLPDLGISGADSHTISFWVNFSDIFARHTLYAQGERSFNNQIDLIYQGDNNRILYAFYSNDLVVRNLGFSEGEWYHLAVTFESGDRRLYLDGVEEASDSPSDPNIVDTECSIGYRRTTGSKFSDARLADFRIYHTALSRSQISTISNNVVNPNFTTLKAPTNVSASVSSNDVTVTWDAADDADGYNILRAPSSGGNFSQIASVGSNTTSFTDTGLQYNEDYAYKIESFN